MERSNQRQGERLEEFGHSYSKSTSSLRNLRHQGALLKRAWRERESMLGRKSDDRPLEPSTHRQILSLTQLQALHQSKTKDLA